LVVPQGSPTSPSACPRLIEDGSIELPEAFRLLIDRLLEHLRAIAAHHEHSSDRLVR
jgi:hypothetical protein